MAKLNSAARAAGVAAEQDARWYIDRRFHDSTNWRVLHDLVLKDPRSTAWCQIDHLVFGRVGVFFVLETKSAVQGMSLHAESGAWTVWYGGKPKPVKSPIAQNIRHIEVLEDFIKQQQLMPKRLFVSIPPAFENWILVQPGARLPKEYGGARLVQRDQFPQVFDSFVEKLSVANIVKLMSGAELDSITGRLEEESRGNKRVRGIPSNGHTLRVSEEPPPLPEPDCDLRFAPPSIRAAHGYAPDFRAPSKSVSVQSPPEASMPGSPKSTACAKCGNEMSSKEVSFCRFNFAKMGRRYLCRSCQ